jgi:hypothetical protein
LEYVYASETADEEAEPADDGKYAAPDLKQPAELPADLVPRMREAVRQGDKALLDTLILAIEQRGDPQSAGALRELADMYQYEKLMEVLAEHAAPSN